MYVVHIRTYPQTMRSAICYKMNVSTASGAGPRLGIRPFFCFIAQFLKISLTIAKFKNLKKYETFNKIYKHVPKQRDARPCKAFRSEPYFAQFVCECL